MRIMRHMRENSILSHTCVPAALIMDAKYLNINIILGCTTDSILIIQEKTTTHEQ